MVEAQKENLDPDRNLGKLSRILYLLTFSTITATGFLNKDSVYEILKFNLLFAVLISILMFYAKERKAELLDRLYNLPVLIFSYLFSVLCIIASCKFNLYNLWLIGPMMIAMLVETDFGLGIHFILSLILIANTGWSFDSFMYNFILGAIGCILAKHILDIKKIGYVLIIFLSSNITLYVVINNFMKDKTININILFSVISSILLFGILFMAERINNSNERNNESLDRILGDNYELLLRFREFSKKLYDRSVYVSDVSGRAAERINANDLLTKAGGMYSKIGRIMGKDYITEGVKLLEEYQFPVEVIDIVKQHNLKYGNPKSKEAAIVMITDNIIASMDAVREMKEGKNISASKLIDGIFSLRLSKSNFAESGLTGDEIRALKNFYQEEFEKSN